MSDSPVDSSKRTWIITSACAGAVGGVATAVPFVSSFQPSEKAKAAGAAVEVDISNLKDGEKLTVEWRGKPVWIIKRTPEQLKELQQEVNEVEGHFMMEFGLDPYQRLKPAGLMRDLRADLQVLERENLRLTRELNGLRADPAAIKDWIKAERQLQKQQDDFDPWF